MADRGRKRQAFLGRLARLPRERVLAEIARNLGAVFNTRKGCGSVLSDFGIGDYERERNTQRAVEVLRDELLTAVRRYEPRMNEVSVRLLGRRRTRMVCFEITGVAHGEPCALAVELDTTTRQLAVRIAEAGR